MDVLDVLDVLDVTDATEAAASKKTTFFSRCFCSSSDDRNDLGDLNSFEDQDGEGVDAGEAGDERGDDEDGKEEVVGKESRKSKRDS